MSALSQLEYITKRLEQMMRFGGARDTALALIEETFCYVTPPAPSGSNDHDFLVVCYAWAIRLDLSCLQEFCIGLKWGDTPPTEEELEQFEREAQGRIKLYAGRFV